MHSKPIHFPSTSFPNISRRHLEILQINLGYLCNMSCAHCHVNAGPKRREIMDRKTIDQIFDFVTETKVGICDLTGGAPEMNPHFRYLIRKLGENNIHVIDRCNLTILEKPEYADLPEFLAGQQVEITASLPCYIEDNVDRQRGKGVFNSSIRVLKRLNYLGYGTPGSGLILNLVYNPQGPVLPPPQSELQQAYTSHLREKFDITFNHLFTLTNMPIQRFGNSLVSKGNFDSYLTLLKANFRKGNLESVMCRNTLSVDWQGYVYDCDFNQMLDLPLGPLNRGKRHISQLKEFTLEGNPIRVAEHCYGCTAGQGSSCGGALES